MLRDTQDIVEWEDEGKGQKYDNPRQKTILNDVKNHLFLLFRWEKFEEVLRGKKFVEDFQEIMWESLNDFEWKISRNFDEWSSGCETKNFSVMKMSWKVHFLCKIYWKFDDVDGLYFHLKLGFQVASFIQVFFEVF